jgi:GNAT superfamily N-acetyltransferase
MRVSVRPATVDDVERIGVVHVRAWQVGYRDVMPAAFLTAFDPADRAAMWRGWFDSASASMLIVGEIDGTIGGFACCGPARGEGDGELYALNVDPNSWGAGLGRALLAAATAALIDAGHDRATLWVVEQNARARRLYEAAGWRWDGAVETDDVGGAPVTELRYVRPLPHPDRE